MRKVEVCFSPALYPFYENKEAVVVVVDIFRATTSICTALANGALGVIPVASIDEAQEYKAKGYLVGAERNVLRCDFADFGNSPFDYTPDHVAGKEIAFTTTNGTQAIHLASDAQALIIGSFINITAVVDFCVNEDRDVVVLCSGWNNRFNFEDTLFAGALVEGLVENGYNLSADSSISALALWNQSKADPMKLISQSEHYERLKNYDMLDQIVYCISVDLITALPILKEGVLVLNK